MTLIAVILQDAVSRRVKASFQKKAIFAVAIDEPFKT
jgi:hypothetical protein